MSYLYSISDAQIKDASKDLLGGKGYGLWKMKQAGLPVPPAYIITTNACRAYMANIDGAAENVMAEIRTQFIPQIVEGFTKEFGYMPLVAVRSGARDSMPGMMDTILNVGLDVSNVISVWGKRLPAACVNDSFNRLIEMYANVVDGFDRRLFEGKAGDERLKAYFGQRGKEFPDAGAQLEGAIEAVFKSWNNERAKTYRKLNGIPDDLGTAVIVQAMVFGNFNDKSGTGVAFSRNHSTGENEVVGDWLANGQGEDVVAGIRNTEPLAAFNEAMPVAGARLMNLIDQLEKTERDMVDVEFTVQDGKLYLLQVRKGKRTSQAALRIAVDMAKEGMISADEAIARVGLKEFLGATRPVISPVWAAKNPPHARGIPASNGCVSGVAVFSSAAAVASKAPCILVAKETTPDDIAGMNAAVGILTATGGATSHAAVVARGMDKVCVVGCTALEPLKKVWRIKGSADERRVEHIIHEGDMLTLDGSTGAIWVCAAPIEGGAASESVARFLALLEQKYPTYRTVTCAEEMAGAEKLLIATYGLDQRDNVHIQSGLQKLLMAIDGREAIIDLRSYADFVREADAPLEYMFGDRGSATDEKVAFVAAMAKQEGLENLKVLALGLNKIQVKNLVTAGCTVIPVVDNISALLAANGLCSANFDALLTVMSKEDVARVLALKKIAGEQVRSFNIVEELDPEQFGRNALFALSPLQAAQSFLKAAP